LNEEIFTPAPEPENTSPPSRLSLLLAGALDSISFSLFCLSYSSLKHALGAVWYRFSADE
jgi:hypothetical protein